MTPAQRALISIGAKCLDFGERSVANDIPIIEFQMVVRLAKKTTTISNCMTDNGYMQNPEWVKYAQPIAQSQAEKTVLTDKIVAEKLGNQSNKKSDKPSNHISESAISANKVSESEALTNLSRTDMQIFEPKNRPDYWIKR